MLFCTWRILADDSTFASSPGLFGGANVVSIRGDLSGGIRSGIGILCRVERCLAATSAKLLFLRLLSFRYFARRFWNQT